MDGEAQVTDAVAAEDVLLTSHRGDTVATEADIVIDDLAARRVPHRYAAAELAHPTILEADDHVLPGERVPRAVEIDAEEVAGQGIVLDDRAGRRPGGENTGIQRRQVHA
ncbi:hypothetical protein D3C80_1730920 [compost metagenome]